MAMVHSFLKELQKREKSWNTVMCSRCLNQETKKGAVLTGATAHASRPK